MWGEVLKINSQEISKDIVSEKAKNDYDELAKHIEESKDLADAFTDHAGEVLKWIQNCMINNFANIDKPELVDDNWTKIQYPKLSTFQTAKDAFDNDINSLKKSNEKTPKKVEDLNKLLEITKQIGYIIQLKELEQWKDPIVGFNAKGLKEFIKNNKIPSQKGIKTDWEKLINEKEKKEGEKSIQIEKTKIEDRNLEQLLSSPATINIADELFGTNEKAWKALLTLWKTWTDRTITDTPSTTKTPQQKKFEELLKIYGGNAWMTSVTSYEFKNYAEKNATINDKSKYDYIQIKWAGTPDKQDIMRGPTTDILHNARSEAYEGTREGSQDIKTNLATLDDNWSYREFEDIVRWQQENATTFLSWLLWGTPWLLKEINDFPAASDKKNKVNGYYGVIIDYIVSTKDEILLGTFLKNIVVGNVVHTEYLWTDRNNQISNLNKIIGKNIWAIDVKSDNWKLLTTIKSQLAQGTDAKSFEKTLSEGFDALMDKFGPILFNVLKFLGFGKWSLLKMFPGSKDRINKEFGEEYNLSAGAKGAIGEISNEYNKTDPLTISDPPTGEELKKSFAKTDAEIDTYISKFTTDKNYYQFINVSVFKKWLDLYNKASKTDTNINDIITTVTDSKKNQSITAIKDQGKFKWIMQSLLKNESTRTRVATANEEMITPTEGKVKGRWDNEYFKNISEAKTSYAIANQQDIVRYLTASLFSDKDLSYVITESTLSNGKKPPAKTSEAPVATTETPDQKFSKNRDLISKDNNMKIDDMKYGSFKCSGFDYKEKPTGDQQWYQDNILKPLEIILADKDQYSLLTKKLADKTEAKSYEWIFKNPIHITNILNMIDIRDNASSPKYKDTISKLKDTKNKFELKIDNDILTFVMTWWTKNETLKLFQEKKDDNNVIKAERTETKVIASK